MTAATGALIEPAHAQAQQVDGSAISYPQWARPYISSGFNAGSNFAGSNQPAYTAKLGSGTVGIFVESSGRDDGAGTSGISGNLFGPQFGFPTSLRQDWSGVSLGNPSWRTSIFGSYKSEPNAALLNGLYTTASFGVTSFRTNPPGFSGLTNFSAGNDVARLTAGAGVGLQLTPQISVEGGFTFTQGPASTLR